MLWAVFGPKQRFIVPIRHDPMLQSRSLRWHETRESRASPSPTSSPACRLCNCVCTRAQVSCFFDFNSAVRGREAGGVVTQFARRARNRKECTWIYVMTELDIRFRCILG